MVNLGSPAVLPKVWGEPQTTISVHLVAGKIDLCSRFPRLTAEKDPTTELPTKVIVLIK